MSRLSNNNSRNRENRNDGRKKFEVVKKRNTQIGRSNDFDLMLFKEAVKIIEAKVKRDFYEIENLQSSNSSTIRNFTIRTIEYIKYTLVKFFKNKRNIYNIIIKGEEDKQEINKNYPTIIIEPLCGILNFMHAVPYFCTTISKKEYTDENDEGQITMGVVNNYSSQELFCVEKSKGAFVDSNVNNLRLRVSNRIELNNSIVAVKLPNNNELSRNVIKKCNFPIKITNCSMLDMIYVTYGKYDCLVAYNTKLINVELGSLIVKEAGGLCEIKENSVIVSNSSLFNKITNLFVVNE